MQNNSRAVSWTQSNLLSSLVNRTTPLRVGLYLHMHQTLWRWCHNMDAQPYFVSDCEVPLRMSSHHRPLRSSSREVQHTSEHSKRSTLNKMINQRNIECRLLHWPLLGGRITCEWSLETLMKLRWVEIELWSMFDHILFCSRIRVCEQRLAFGRVRGLVVFIFMIDSLDSRLERSSVNRMMM